MIVANAHEEMIARWPFMLWAHVGDGGVFFRPQNVRTVSTKSRNEAQIARDGFDIRAE